MKVVEGRSASFRGNRIGFENEEAIHQQTDEILTWRSFCIGDRECGLVLWCLPTKVT